MERRWADLQAEISADIPGFRIRRKDRSVLQRLVGALLCVATFGGQRSYLQRYVTTIRRTVWVPKDFDDWPLSTRIIVLEHEWVHLRQFRRYTLPGMVLLYFLPIFPVGLAWGRARLEWEAYAETIRRTWALEGEAAARALRPEILRRFTGPDYLWMWPFPRQVGRWIDQTLAACAAGGKGGPGR